MIFLNYDQAGLDRQYDQRVWAANAVEVIRRYGENSDRVRAALGEPTAFSYGPSPAETLDLYPTAAPNAPVHVFIHGGAWRTQSKRDSAFPAETFVRAGAHYIALDFALLPTVTMTEMVDQVRRGVAWVYRNAPTFGGDPARIHISGHSSGGHLAGCVAVTDWDVYGLPQDVVKSTICASGMYDLQAVRLSARNEYVRLTPETEHAFSPIRHLRHLHAPVFVAYGGLESDEFKRHSREFATALGSHLSAPLAEYKEMNHFEVADTLADPKARLGRVALDFLGL